jgi:undecaprenyl diphosphate synthase
MTDPSPLDPDRIPTHVAIVMDGNGRWAKQRKKPRLYGHKTGADSVREIVEMSREIGIGHLTLYAFSSENWNRPQQEVSGLMNILKSYLVSELGRMEKNEIRLNCIGDDSKLPKAVQETLRNSIRRTAGNDKLVLNLALSYGARDEICRGVSLIAQACKNGDLQLHQIDHQCISDHLYTAGQPDPDLLIRTGGERRLSNFLLWQASYAEIYFTETMWPDFRRDAFLQALLDFQQRERRFGKTGDQVRENGT